MNNWIIAMIITSLISLTIQAVYNGKPKTGKHNFAMTLMSQAISWFMILGALGIYN